MKVDGDVKHYTDDQLKMYNFTYTELNKQYPNNYYKYMIDCSCKELRKRGLEP